VCSFWNGQSRPFLFLFFCTKISWLAVNGYVQDQLKVDRVFALIVLLFRYILYWIVKKTPLRVTTPSMASWAGHLPQFLLFYYVIVELILLPTTVKGLSIEDVRSQGGEGRFVHNRHFVDKGEEVFQMRT